MAERTLYLAAYDISSPTRLKAALHLVKNHACGGQKSAYECFLSETEKAELLMDMSLVIDEEQDRFVLIKMHRNASTYCLGKATKPENPELFFFS